MNLDIYYNDGQTELSLNENNIEDLSVTEEINLISDALPINTATFTVTETSDISFLHKNGNVSIRARNGSLNLIDIPDFVQSEPISPTSWNRDAIDLTDSLERRKAYTVYCKIDARYSDCCEFYLMLRKTKKTGVSYMINSNKIEYQTEGYAIINFTYETDLKRVDLIKADNLAGSEGLLAIWQDFMLVEGTYTSADNLPPYEKSKPVKYKSSFYFNEAKQTAINKYQISCYCHIGKLDSETFNGALYSGDTPFATVVNDIIEDSVPYEIIGDFSTFYPSGYIPKSTKREALKQVLFTVGAVADSTRNDILRIYKPDTNLKTYIESSKVYMNGSLDKNKPFEGVSVKSYRYMTGSKETELFNGLINGDVFIGFDGPYSNVSVSGSGITIKKNNPTYIIISGNNVNAVVKGYKYEEIANVYNFGVPGSSSIQDCKLINTANVTETAKRVLMANESIYSLNEQILFNGERCTDKCYIESNFGSKYGIINQMVLNFGSSIISAQIKFINVSDVSETWDYTGELYTDDSIGLT